MNTSASDTIVAVSSPPGRSLRGLIRLTGQATPTILSMLLRPNTSTTLKKTTPKIAASKTQSPLPNARTLTTQQIALSNHQTLPCLVSLFKAPKSYTGQDMAEIQVPGNAALLDRLLHQICSLGARLAEPGEFTFRAYTAGKLDLTQAEGVAATIAATSDGQLQAARHLLQGKLGQFSQALVDQLANVLALVEAGIDFTDQEDVVPISASQLTDQLHKITQQVNTLITHSRSWGALESLPRVVLFGLPSCGKSTLFNALLGHQRAVIHELPGTTRDVLAEPVTWSDQVGRKHEIMLTDIAGLDHAETALDIAAQQAAHQAIEQADLILQISDHLSAHPQNSPLQHSLPPHLLHLVENKLVLHVQTKIDLAPLPASETANTLGVCALTGVGLDLLKDKITNALGESGLTASSQILFLQPRHEQSIKRTSQALAYCNETLQLQKDPNQLDHVELIASNLRDALDELASLGGQMTPDDVLGKVFSTFCVGK